VQPLLQWKGHVSISYSECFCSLRYPACNAHAPYCNLWSTRLYNIFPHYLINCTIFEGGGDLLNRKCVFWFSLQLLSETFLILERTERDMNKNVHWSSFKVTVILVRLYETWIFSTDFQKYSNIKFHWHLSSWSRVVPRGQSWQS
jgi:hypothetical protein